MLPFASAAIECGVFSWPCPDPRSPHVFTHRPFLSTFTTRELPYPSLMKTFPCGSQVTSVGRLNDPHPGAGVGAFAGRGAAGCAGFPRGPGPPNPRPAGLNLADTL